MARPAMYPGTCTRCGKSITPGDMVNFFNRPRPKSIFHARCPGMPETPEEAAPETPEAPEAQAPEATPRPAGSIDAIIDARIDARLAGFEPSAALSEDDVKRLVGEAQAQVAPVVTVEVKRVDGSTFKSDSEHYLFPRLCKLLGAGLHVYLWGPAGSGKTTAAIRAAVALGKTSELDTLDPSTPKSGVLGYRTPAGDPAETAFTRMYASGGVYVADECDNAPAHVQSLLNSALANGHAPCAWGQVARGEGFVFAGTGNTPGRPTPAFPDRRPMSAAFADRLYFMHWPLDPAIECRAASLPPPRRPSRKDTTCDPAAWVTWVRAVRAWAEQSAPTLMVTPRASLLGLQALALGETPEEVAHGLVFRGADKALTAKALDAVPLPG